MCEVFGCEEPAEYTFEGLMFYIESSDPRALCENHYNQEVARETRRR